MKAEDLMKPRFEIIADFPNNDFGKVGEILDRDWCKYIEDNEEGGVEWSISDFPHLFRKLNWWEHREVEDMPTRLISKAFANEETKELSEEVFEIEEWDMKLLVGWTNKEKRECCSLLSWNPEYGYFPVD
jgi:hypothetical protein